MTSQVLAVFYLSELDYFIKNNLKIKYYIRYMDDGILIHEDKYYLRFCLNKIDNIIKKYKLKLNSKTKIYSKKEGFEFLGFRYNIKNNRLIMKVNNKTKNNFKRKMKFDNDNILNSYLGHLRYGDTGSLIYFVVNIKNGLS